MSPDRGFREHTKNDHRGLMLFRQRVAFREQKADRFLWVKGVMGIRVLLADQRPLFRQGVRFALAANGTVEVVAEAEDGYTAVAAAEQHVPEVAILSVDLPHLNGIEAARRIRNNLTTRVLLLASPATRYLVGPALQAGATGFMSSTCDPVEVSAACRSVALGDIYIGQGISGDSTPASMLTPRNQSSRAYQILTPREREVVQLLAEGMTSKEIAGRLHVSVRTVESHRRQIMSKLSLQSVVELTKFALREGLTML